MRATTAVRRLSSQTSTSPSLELDPPVERDRQLGPPLVWPSADRFFCASHWSRCRASTVAPASRSLHSGSWMLPSTAFDQDHGRPPRALDSFS